MAIKQFMEQEGHIMRGGTIVDATIIDAPKSTKNQAQERDPEMHQTKKGNQWYFGAKYHVGVDAGTVWFIPLRQLQRMLPIQM